MDQKVAIVAGANKGMGKAISLYLAKKGYKLLLIARNEEHLKNVQQEIEEKILDKKEAALKDRVMIAAVDITDFESLKTVITQFVGKKGQLDLLVNSAGIAKGGTSDISRTDFSDMIQVNLVGAFNLTYLVAPFMKNQKYGRIINIASRAGKVALKYLGAYAASKFGMIGFNEALYKELIEHGVYVTAICPGLVYTDMTAGLGMPAEEMINVLDIVKTVDYLLAVSPAVCIKEIILECKHTVITENKLLVHKADD